MTDQDDMFDHWRQKVREAETARDEAMAEQVRIQKRLDDLRAMPPEDVVYRQQLEQKLQDYDDAATVDQKAYVSLRDRVRSAELKAMRVSHALDQAVLDAQGALETEPEFEAPGESWLKSLVICKQRLRRDLDAVHNELLQTALVLNQSTTDLKEMQRLYAEAKKR